MRNDYKIMNDYVIIYLKDRSGKIFETLIDIEDFDRVKEFNYTWSPDYRKFVDNYYANATQYLGMVDGKPKYKSVLLHRLIMNAPKRKFVDHINHNTLDNRKENLRVVEPTLNSKNRLSANKNTTSGERNVSWSNVEQKWLVQLQVNKRNTCFGKFDYEDLDRAIRLARQKRKEIYGYLDT